MNITAYKFQPTVRWLQKNLFSSPLNCIITIVLLVGIVQVSINVLDWAILKSSWGTTSAECRQTSGACWSFLQEKARFIIMGYYPWGEQWRPAFLIAIFFGLFFLSIFKYFRSRKLVAAWILFTLLSLAIMRGGFWGLPYVPTDQWSGLPLTLILAFVGIIFSYPIGILLALGRRSSMPVIHLLSVIYIELIRGVPLISILFMSSVMFPLFLPEGVTLDKVIRAQLALIIFSSAYMAEIVRGGLQNIPRGQYEASKAIGLNYPQMIGLVILPQALRVIIPATVNNFISLFKDTALIFIISLSDLMFTTKAALKDSEWIGFSIEGYIFLASIYFIFCYFMGKISSHIEKELSKQQNT